jgi:hypothetical protein
VGKNTNIIEINGKKYDAKTGAVLSHAGLSATKIIEHPKPKTKAARQAAQHLKRHEPEHSHALMRHAVKKPRVEPKTIQARGHSSKLSKQPLAAVIVKQSVHKVDKTRLAKASRVPQSHLISHFSTATSDNNALRFFTPVVQKAQPITQPHAHPTKAKPRTTADILEHAIRHATSHQQVHHAPKKKHRAGLVAASVAAVLAVGVVAYQQMPSAKLKLASARAGIAASLPGYQPAGYSLGQLDYSAGSVATQFQSNSDGRHYTLTQKASSWDNQTLLSSYVKPNCSNYETVPAGNLTVYLYGNGGATWVNHGLWYSVKSDGSLNHDQLVALAKSL